MHEAIRHDWNLTPAQARQLQSRLAERLLIKDDFNAIKTVAGLDVGFPDKGRVTRAAVVLMRLDGLIPLEQSVVECPTRFPYVPGLLSFREVPALLKALGGLTRTPDLLLCDGQGLAHPRRLGVACHIGLLTALPAIGVGKSRLVGEYQTPGEEKGEWTPLTDRGETIGCVLRSRRRVRPLFVSPGHRVGLDASRRLVMDCLGRYRLPEPIRRADRLAGQY